MVMTTPVLVLIINGSRCVTWNETGNGVVGNFYGPHGEFLLRIHDTNGSAGGCGNARAEKPIVMFDVCEIQEFGWNSCSRMKNT